jgi:hypothetical protein
VNPNVLHSLAAGGSGGARERLSGAGAAALVRGPCSGVVTQDRPAGGGDRFSEGVLAAHRRTAHAAGIEWKSAVYKVAEALTEGVD